MKKTTTTHIQMPKVECSECRKKVYINTVPVAFCSEDGGTVYICGLCRVKMKGEKYYDRKQDNQG